ncbi:MULTISPECIES: plasmid mobilization protein [Flagellimonas]|uniref:plasmid mobilization protein n=1 Tax=Flagellimonas TaxID=444459 RepID=UPI00296EB508|nr:plasmid mobilization relaxosome protein MobC [Muricauda sp. DH64]
MARPKKDISKQRTIVIAFRVSQNEYVIITNNAETIGLSVAEYIRRKCTGKSLPKKRVDPLDRKLFIELSRVGNNLNQLVRVSNSGIRDPFSIHKQLEEVKMLLQQLKSNISNDDR